MTVLLSINPEVLITLIAGTLLLLLLAALLVFFVLSYKKSFQQHKLEKVTMEAQYEAMVLQAQLEIQEETMKAISLEIHDNIGQALSLAKLNLNTLPDTIDPALANKFTGTTRLISKAISDLRTLSHTLNNDYVKDLGLLRAIEGELNVLADTGVLETRLNVLGEYFALDAGKELILFRIVQESISNVIKHAFATELLVSLSYEPDHLVLVISDDGKGMDPDRMNEHGNNSFGCGLKNMSNRAKLLGGKFEMESSRGTGTRIIITLPTEPPNLETSKPK